MTNFIENAMEVLKRIYILHRNVARNVAAEISNPRLWFSKRSKNESARGDYHPRGLSRQARYVQRLGKSLCCAHPAGPQMLWNER